MTRRKALQTCASGFGYLAFSALAHRAAAASGSALSVREPHFAATAKRVIFLCMKGGPSHVDLFDHKPELIRRNGELLSKDSKYGAKLLGPVQPLTQHAKSGLRISELFPHLAKHADDLCVINSMNTDLPNHSPAFGQMHTGSFQFIRPSLGAWTLYGLGSENENLPGFISLNPPSDFGGAQNYGSAFLPSICQGTKIGGGQTPALYASLTGRHEEPGPPMKNIEGQVSKEMQRAQIDLVQSMNRLKLKQERYQPEIEGAIESLELAFRMQAEVPGTLDIQSEPEHIKKLYGIGNKGGDRFARQCLLARRLAESGVRFIEITAPVNWDHHYMLRNNLAKSCAATDRPIAGLLSDLKSRDMLKDTLVVWAGEFGRTPYAQGADGRDHNNKGYSIWMAGGGLKGGMAYGSTDEFGQKAMINPVHIHDWHATILHLLGLDHKRLTHNYAGRDFRLTNVYGEVVKDIIA